ncbi:uncharacterized protein LOC131229538 [Magnolia sinica]|uniref:uncharacterized protein LOC131229538 n=1 Tax=Magnolia sinica TaxID=86752 RepID=UPI002657D3EE|nr:uncharacterized protein LOC131229538 [Magnolia sinica]
MVLTWSIVIGVCYLKNLVIFASVKYYLEESTCIASISSDEYFDSVALLCDLETGNTTESVPNMLIAGLMSLHLRDHIRWFYNHHLQILSSLEEHFGTCGEIARISAPKDYDTGASKGSGSL